MYRFYLDYKGQKRTGNIELFLQISIDNYDKVVACNEELTELRKIELRKNVENGSLTEKEKEILTRTGNLSRAKYKNTIQGIIMLASYYEALINEIGRIELGSKYYSDNIDKLSVTAKWEVVLKLIYGKSLRKDSQQYESMNSIIKERNNLVHYKTKVLENASREDLKAENNKVNRQLKLFNQSIERLKEFHDELESLDKSKGLFYFFQFSKEIERIKPAHNNKK